MPAPKTEERKVAMEWFAMTTAERWEKGFPLNDKEMRAKLGVKTTVWNKWINQFHEKQKRDVVMKCHPMATGGEKPQEVEVIKSEYDSEAYLNDHVDKVDEALIEACDQNNAQALKIFYQLTKRLVEKTETTHTILSAEDVSRIDREADRKIRELNQGTRGVSNREEGVSKERPLLPEKIWEDKG